VGCHSYSSHREKRWRSRTTRARLDGEKVGKSTSSKPSQAVKGRKCRKKSTCCQYRTKPEGKTGQTQNIETVCHCDVRERQKRQSQAKDQAPKRSAAKGRWEGQGQEFKPKDNTAIENAVCMQCKSTLSPSQVGAGQSWARKKIIHTYSIMKL